MAEIGSRRDIDVDVNLLRHMVVNIIRSHKVKFGREYGQIIIACDSKKYWRKAYFPFYKANRKKSRDESGLNWTNIFDSINLIKEEIKNVFPYKLIEIEGAEADDVIATLAKSTSDPVLIISGDHDFIQLQKRNNVSQYSPTTKKMLKSDVDVGRYIFEHIVRGDRGDGVPNVLTGDDAIVTGERQRTISSKKLLDWINNPLSLPQDEMFKRNFDRNKKLIDLDQIPEDITEAILNEYNKQTPSDGSDILNYLIKNKMKQLMEHLEEF